MDYDQVYARLEEARADSLAYLKAALEGTALPAEETEPAPAAKPGALQGRGLHGLYRLRCRLSGKRH